MTLGNDNGTDGQTDGQTDRQSATQYAAPPREEGRIITACRPNGSVIAFAKRNNKINHVVESTLAIIGKKYILRNRIGASVGSRKLSSTKDPFSVRGSDKFCGFASATGRVHSPHICVTDVERVVCLEGHA